MPPQQTPRRPTRQEARPEQLGDVDTSIYKVFTASRAPPARLVVREAAGSHIARHKSAHAPMDDRAGTEYTCKDYVDS